MAYSGVSGVTDGGVEGKRVETVKVICAGYPGVLPL